jgi:hypothetical protein
MSKKKMIAYCGLTCTDCDAYKATQKHDLELAKKTAAAWSAQFHTNVLVENIWCDGCTVDGKKCAHCGECEIRACAQKHGVANCGVCSDYPCKTVAGLLAMVPAAKATLDRIHAA